jgi:ligand-binding sensor domain-containing protein
VGAQDLPAITYTTAEGLPADVVIRVVQDATGFLWVGTSTALARFDGEAFKVFGKREGLDVGTGVNHLGFDAQGHLWIATNGAGLMRFDLTTSDPATRLKQFSVGQGRPANRVNSFTLTPDGGLWAGTDAGLFVGRQDSGQFRRLDLPIGTRSQDSLQVTSVVPHGSDFWLTTSAGLYRCHTAASWVCTDVLGIAASSMLIDREERLWVGTEAGVKVWKLKDGTLSGAPHEIGDWNVLRLGQASGDAVLVGTVDGRVIVVHNGLAEVIFETATSPIYDVVEDAAHNLWVATRRGLVAIRRQGIRLFASRHGLQEPYVRSLFRDAHSRVYALTEGFWVHRVDGNRLISVRLVLPAGVRRSTFFGSSVRVDVAGDIWLGTAKGCAATRASRFRRSRASIDPRGSIRGPTVWRATTSLVCSRTRPPTAGSSACPLGRIPSRSGGVKPVGSSASTSRTACRRSISLLTLSRRRLASYGLRCEKAARRAYATGKRLFSASRTGCRRSSRTSGRPQRAPLVRGLGWIIASRIPPRT